VDELVVMVYAADVTEVPLQVRAGWIQALYPMVRIIEAGTAHARLWRRRESPRAGGLHIKLDGLQLRISVSEFYGHVSRALGAVVGELMKRVPRCTISGTKRADYFAQRQYVTPNVYADNQ
jgi:hypothetical protein